MLEPSNSEVKSVVMVAWELSVLTTGQQKSLQKVSEAYDSERTDANQRNSEELKIWILNFIRANSGNTPTFLFAK